MQTARPLDAEDSVEMDSPLEPPEGTNPAHTWIAHLSLVRLILTLELKENKFMLL